MSEVTITITGERRLNVQLGGRGTRGIPGLSAYELAVENGYVGSIEQWLDDLEGDPGSNIELQKSATHLQWRVAGSSEWLNLIPLSELKGNTGDTGANIELQKSATHIQWRVSGSNEWLNLIPLSELKGNTGDPGSNIELQKSATHIQWRVVGGLAWYDLVALADIKGNTGDKGDTGANIELQKSATHMQWRVVGTTTWNDLIALSDLKGNTGDRGPAGQTIYLAIVQVLDGAASLTTGDGKCYFRIPAALNGMNLITCNAQVITKSSSGTPTVMITRGRQASATSDFTYVDMLSTPITIDANEYDSKDAVTQPVINASNDDLATGDVIRIDVDVAGTGTKGLNVSLSFQLP